MLPAAVFDYLLKSCNKFNSLCFPGFYSVSKFLPLKLTSLTLGFIFQFFQISSESVSWWHVAELCLLDCFRDFTNITKLVPTVCVKYEIISESALYFNVQLLFVNNAVNTLVKPTEQILWVRPIQRQQKLPFLPLSLQSVHPYDVILLLHTYYYIIID